MKTDSSLQQLPNFLNIDWEQWAKQFQDNMNLLSQRIKELIEVETASNDFLQEFNLLRCAWTIENVAYWISKYDAIDKQGTMREPYDYETWILIIQDVAKDYVESL